MRGTTNSADIGLKRDIKLIQLIKEESLPLAMSGGSGGGGAITSLSLMGIEEAKYMYERIFELLDKSPYSLLGSIVRVQKRVGEHVANLLVNQLSRTEVAGFNAFFNDITDSDDNFILKMMLVNLRETLAQFKFDLDDVVARIDRPADESDIEELRVTKALLEKDVQIFELLLEETEKEFRIRDVLTNEIRKKLEASVIDGLRRKSNADFEAAYRAEGVRFLERMQQEDVEANEAMKQDLLSRIEKLQQVGGDITGLNELADGLKPEQARSFETQYHRAVLQVGEKVREQLNLIIAEEQLRWRKPEFNEKRIFDSSKPWTSHDLAQNPSFQVGAVVSGTFEEWFTRETLKLVAREKIESNEWKEYMKLSEIKLKSGDQRELYMFNGNRLMVQLEKYLGTRRDKAKNLIFLMENISTHEFKQFLEKRYSILAMEEFNPVGSMSASFTLSVASIPEYFDLKIIERNLNYLKTLRYGEQFVLRFQHRQQQVVDIVKEASQLQEQIDHPGRGVDVNALKARRNEIFHDFKSNEIDLYLSRKMKDLKNSLKTFLIGKELELIWIETGRDGNIGKHGDLNNPLVKRISLIDSKTLFDLMINESEKNLKEFLQAEYIVKRAKEAFELFEAQKKGFMIEIENLLWYFWNSHNSILDVVTKFPNRWFDSLKATEAQRGEFLNIFAESRDKQQELKRLVEEGIRVWSSGGQEDKQQWMTTFVAGSPKSANLDSVIWELKDEFVGDAEDLKSVLGQMTVDFAVNEIYTIIWPKLKGLPTPSDERSQLESLIDTRIGKFISPHNTGALHSSKFWRDMPEEKQGFKEWLVRKYPLPL